MAVVGVMRCPANHATDDSAGKVAFIREWATATSWTARTGPFETMFESR
jgi:hypothetical protein